MHYGFCFLRLGLVKVRAQLLAMSKRDEYTLRDVSRNAKRIRISATDSSRLLVETRTHCSASPTFD
jgi:hypothetical protein